MSRTHLLKQVLTGRGRALRHVAAWSVVEGLPTLLSGVVLAHALSAGFLVGRPLVGVAWLAVLAVAAGIAAVATSRLYPWLAEVVEPTREQLVIGTVAGALGRVVRRSVGPVTGTPADVGPALAQSVEQTDTARQVLAAILRGARQVVVPLFTSLAGLLVLSPRLALVVAAPVVLALLVYSLVVTVMFRRQREALLAEEAVAAESVRVFTGLQDIAATGAAEWAQERLARRADEACVAARRVALVDLARHGVVALAVVGPVLGLLVAAQRWLPSGAITVAGLVGAVAYVQQGLAVAVRSVVHTGGGWAVELAVVLDRLAEVSDAAPHQMGEQVDHGPDAEGRPRHAPSGRAAVQVDGVTYAYGPKALPVIDRLDLHLAPGEHLAVVGPSGVGKSTLALLIAGLLPTQAGQILVNDHAAWTGGPVATGVVLVPQEAYVAVGSVRENLTYLRPTADDATVRDAVHLFGLGDVVDRLGGLDGLVPPGAAGLSDGERQLLCLARAWVAQASVVVLDEATCHLGELDEARAESALRAGGRTTLVVVAHRLSAAHRADRVLVLDGAQATCGTPDQVAVTSRLFRELVAWQSTVR